MIVSEEQQKRVQKMSYFAQNLILIIKETKKMTSERKYMTQREWIDYCTQKHIRMKEVIEKIWFWIKKDCSWKKFHKKFKDFEKEYFVIMSIIRQARNLQKMIDEVMNHIAERWKFNSRIFKNLRLHTLRAIKKCARAEYFMKEILQRLKLTVMYRLRNSKRDISRAILSNATNWIRVIDDLFDTERMTTQKLRELDLLHRESFFSRREFEFAFSSLSSETSNMIITTLINALITKALSTLDLISKKFIIDDRDIIIEDESVTRENIEDESATDDLDTTESFDTIEDSDTTDDFDVIGDSDIIEDSDITDDSDATDDSDTTESSDITDDSDAIGDSDIIEDSDTTIEDSDTTSSASKRRRSDSHDEENCDCRDLDVAWKTDLERHDNQIQNQRETLLLFSSMMYVNWEICEIHNELLRVAFNLNAYEQRRMINLKLICIWKDRWNLIDIKTRHQLWFE